MSFCHLILSGAPPCGHTKSPANPRRARPPSINKPAQRTATRLRLPSTVYLCRLAHSITGRGIIVKAGLTFPYGFAILMLEPVDVRELVSTTSVPGTADSVFMPFWLSFSSLHPRGIGTLGCTEAVKQIHHMQSCSLRCLCITAVKRRFKLIRL